MFKLQCEESFIISAVGRENGNRVGFRNPPPRVPVLVGLDHRLPVDAAQHQGLLLLEELDDLTQPSGMEQAAADKGAQVFKRQVRHHPKA